MIRRREFITLLGSAAATWPLAARAQQTAMPVIGFLHSQSPAANADRLRGFHRGLKDSGYVEGENVTIVYRWAENQIDRLPELAADLVRRQVAVITAVGGPVSVLAAKEATTTIPIVFNVNDDPVKLGFAASLSRPGGNLTGINFLSGELVAKRLELLHQLVPAATRLAVLVNPGHNPNTSELRGVEQAARALGLQIQVLNASTIREIDAAFTTLESERADALFVAGEAFFTSRRVQFAVLAVRHTIPASTCEYPGVGGL
jgi:putative tryptophan/tyrosine transport system substrate-binding protein